MTPEPEPSAAAIIEQLAARRADAQTTLELIDGYALQVEASAADFENPGAVRQYLSFFRDLISAIVAECDQIAGRLATTVDPEDSARLRQLASNCAAEQRRCLQFRDKWINKPLPHERIRPLLNDISITTRDQLTAYLDLNRAAAAIDALQPPAPQAPPDDPRNFDRRKLFTKFFKI